MTNGTTFNIMKLLLFSKFSMSYAENIIVDNKLQGEQKQYWKDIVNRHQYLISKLKVHIPPTAAEKLRQDMECIDIENLDSIINMLLTFKPEQRGEVEDYLTSLTMKFLKEHQPEQQIQAL